MLRHGDAGMLATAARRFDGHPFGSVVRYALDGGGRPLLLMSRLAEHTRNVDADPRVSLLVAELGGDVQVDARVTVVGRCARASGDGEAAARYLRRFPDAAELLELGDFDFFRIAPLTVRYIAGFGRIHWLPPQAILEADCEIADAEATLLAEIDRDRLAALWTRHGGPATDSVQPCGIDADGIELQAGGRRRRIDFPQPVTGVDAARAAVEELLRGERR